MTGPDERSPEAASMELWAVPLEISSRELDLTDVQYLCEHLGYLSPEVVSGDGTWLITLHIRAPSLRAAVIYAHDSVVLVAEEKGLVNLHIVPRSPS
jgi:hypothetical protein